MSEPMNAAFVALAKAQTEMGKALKSAENPHFKSKYTDLASVYEACLPALNANGFAVMQYTTQDEAGHHLKTVFAHSGGHVIECLTPMLIGKNDMQGIGSAITYARRYGLMGLAGLAPEDDDGNLTVDQAKRSKGHAAQGIGDAWTDGVLDSLPPNATDRQKAEGFAKQIEADFNQYKSIKGLAGGWAKRENIINRLAATHDDLHQNLCDVYESCRNALTDPANMEPAE